MSDTFHIVIVEDDLVTRKRLGALLRQQRYTVSEAEDADQMERIIERDNPDLLLVDINLDGKDGLQITREQRAQSDIAIILLTSRSDQVDRIIGLEMGADDYVTKPFDARELLARVKVLLYRVGLHRKTQAQQLEPCTMFGSWTFDPKRRRIVQEDGTAVVLTRGEFELLNAFTQHSGQVLSRSRLLQSVTHRQFVSDTRIVDVLVGRLRRKIEQDPPHPEHIITVHGEGYLFIGDDP
ncbi:TorCAD operon transcriptional regulatory protein TorR [Pseudovibrio sp. W64]|uniref:response regulator n=1 Tax=unclassified Pseudovibrio TaxID=2627060 RepID=UPI0007AE41B8|nr:MULTISPECIES: response regulator [unclassified Pseudovibrio]KZK86261.1 TorCAD operon transcriptional regulatory protein TorR [Pseudovibrio sp. W64]KZK96582.1 TorCAD operon transcriptional regulatory protein TorR [Pseudovibrio sp. Ad5]